MPPTTPPLRAVVTDRDGQYVMTVSGVEIGTASDLVEVTNRLCTEAAKHRRRVFVEIATLRSRDNLEIDESGHISRTAPPAPTTATPQLPTPVVTTPTPPVAAPTRPTPLPPSAQVSRASIPAAAAAVAGAAPGRTRRRPTVRSWTWRRVAALLALLAVATAGAGTAHRLTEQTRPLAEQARALRHLPATDAGDLEALRSRFHGPLATAGPAALRDAARRHQLVWAAGGVETRSPVRIGTPVGAVSSTGVAVRFSVHGARAEVTAFLAELPTIVPAPQLRHLSLRPAGTGMAADVDVEFHQLTPDQR